MKKSQNFLFFLTAGFFVLVLSVLISKGRILGLFSREVEIILTGDVMLGRTVMTKSLSLKDPTYPFKKVADVLRGADIVFINLETPIVADCPRHYDGLIFCADPKMIDGLKYAGVDVVTLANNHTLNYGNSGLEETKKILEQSGISYVGVGNLVEKVVSGTRLGFLGFNFVDKGPTAADLKLISSSDKKVDILIVGVHWGVEYRDKATELQRDIATKLVDAGADVVVGHHPHWVQNMEYIEGKPVYYSLGNFVFDQMWSQKTREGLTMRLVFDGPKLVREEKLPIYMSSWAQPEFVK